MNGIDPPLPFTAVPGARDKELPPPPPSSSTSFTSSVSSPLALGFELKAQQLESENNKLRDTVNQLESEI